MAELWPTSLPQKLNVQGHSYDFGDPTIRSNPSVGPSKVRPRSSAVASPLSGQMYLTTAQLDTLRTFYQITVRGADVFIFPNPEGGTAINCRFVGAPTVSAVSKPDCWTVSLPMEVIP
jgi:hypothetical protein